MAETVIREVVKGMYAIDGIFRDVSDYFAPSPLYQGRRRDRPEHSPGTPDQSPPGDDDVDES